ncbi:MAG TPA: fused MFS/spermidine synthase, partial [Polyangiaceae bacterium]|nr:fused MFS/spermidine synthase [Polyangiaceae bacterium]
MSQPASEPKGRTSDAPHSALRERERDAGVAPGFADEGAATAGAVTRRRALPFGVTLGLFVVSGATGLVDQLCFSKYLGYIVGSTAYAVSAVLAAFMTGLALGAHWGGKLSARIRRPLVAYGWLELVVAVAVALTPLGFRALTPFYASLAESAPESLATLTVLRWLVALLLVIVPTTAMGATLPFLSRGIESDQLADEGDASMPSDARRKERRLTWLYASNTLGGATGALLAAYAVLPVLGIQGTLLASALGSALVGVVALWLGRDRVVEQQPATAVTAAASAPV